MEAAVAQKRYEFCQLGLACDPRRVPPCIKHTYLYTEQDAVNNAMERLGLFFIPNQAALDPSKPLRQVDISSLLV